MYNGEGRKQEQSALLDDGVYTKPNVRSKRVDIVSLRIVKESSLLYKDRSVKSPEDA
jgi:DNA repair protein RadC